MSKLFNLNQISFVTVFFLTNLYSMEECSDSHYNSHLIEPNFATAIKPTEKFLKIKTSDGDFIKLSEALACLSPRLEATFFDDSAVPPEEINNRVWNLKSKQKQINHFPKGYPCSSYKSLISFIKLLKAVNLFRSGRLEPNELINRLNSRPLQRKIDCIILADFLDIPELKIAGIQELASHFEYIKNVYNFREDEKSYNNINRLKAPLITQSASHVFINKHFNRFTKFFCQFIEKQSSFRYPGNQKIIAFDKKNDILFTNKKGDIELTFLDPNLKHTIDKIKLNKYPIDNFIVSDNYEYIAASRILLNKKQVSNKGSTKERNSAIYIWQIKNGKRSLEISFPDYINTLAFSMSSDKLAVLTYNLKGKSKVYVYNLQIISDKMEAQLVNILDFENTLDEFLAFNKWSDGIIIATKSGEIIEKDIKTKQVIKNLEEDELISICALHPSHQKLITYSMCGKISIWNLFDKKIEGSFYPSRKINKFTFPTLDSNINYVIAQTDMGAYLIDLATCSPLIFINRARISDCISLDENNILILNATKKSYIEKLDLSILNKFFYSNDGLYKQLALIYTCLIFKNFDLSKAAPHIKKLLKKLPKEFKEYLMPDAEISTS